jgi:hypothetical protein
VKGSVRVTIGESINQHNRQYSPYMGSLVNHLPMGQMALYQMTKDLDRVEEYARYFTERFSIDPVTKNSVSAASLEECVGQRARYAECLPVPKEMIEKQGMESTVAAVLNQYMLGMSSGLFHVLIRLAYAVEGAEMERVLEEEVARALSYYVTGYRKAGVLDRKINLDEIMDEMNKLKDHSGISRLLNEQPSMSRKLEALYNSDLYYEQGFIIGGTEKDKVTGILDLAIPAFLQSNNIVVLHCITGLHALLNLKPFFNDFEQALDVYFTCCLTHLLTVDGLTFHESAWNKKESKTDIGWEELLSRGSQSRDVHTIKFTYTSHQLEARHGFEQSGIKGAALYRIERD